MQDLPTGWAEARAGLYRMETKVSIAGVDYSESELFSVSTSAALFSGSTVGIGGCVAKEIDLTVMPQGDIPRMAEIIVWVRPVADGIETDWLQKGVFYIDTRNEDKVTGLLTIHGYDAMLKAEQTYLQEGDTDEWPRAESVVVADIAARMGVEIDSRTVLSDTYMVAYPNDLTMREILGYVAAAHGGNWIITDAGALRLVPLTGSADTVDLQDLAASLDYAPAFEAVTGVRLWYDDEACYFAGDETGRVLEADCPWATQAMADEVLASILGFEYQPFETGTPRLDMEAELGDGVSIGGVYGPLASINTTFGSLCAADIGAPADEEVDHEYPYLTRQERALQRKMSLGKAYYGTRITRQNGLEVVTTAADGTESALARFNSDVLAFYDADGQEALYFDAAAGKYRFRGDVEITGGTMNVSNNFIVDEQGNVTINGNINLSGGTITWGSNNPADGSGISSSEAKTLITRTLVSSPTIAGGKFMNLVQDTWIKIGEETGAVGLELTNGYGNMFTVYNGDFDITSFGAKNGYYFLITDGETSTSYPGGTWDFSSATVTGLDIDVTATAVWG